MKTCGQYWNLKNFQFSLPSVKFLPVPPKRFKRVGIIKVDCDWIFAEFGGEERPFSEI